MSTALQREFAIDAIDRKLLHHLQQHGRLSFAELARRVRLTTPAVIERVRKLEDAGIILGYHAEVSAAKMGLPVLALIRMSVVGDVFAKVATVVKDSRKFSSVTRNRRGLVYDEGRRTLGAALGSLMTASHRSAQLLHPLSFRPR